MICWPKVPGPRIGTISVISGRRLPKDSCNAGMLCSSMYTVRLSSSILGHYVVQWSEPRRLLPNSRSLNVDPRFYRDVKGNSSVKGPSSTENFSKSSMRTSFRVCSAVASSTTLLVNSDTSVYPSEQLHPRIPPWP